MKICLVVYKYGIYIGDPTPYPLGFMYISSSLKARGHDVKVLNYNLRKYDFTAEIKGYDAVLFTGFEAFKSDIIRDSAICRSMGIHTVLGGGLATYCADEMGSHVDALVIGEGENGVEPALIGNGVFNVPLQSIDNIPYPDYVGFGVEEYHLRNEKKYMGVLTSRGCPHSCSFCASICKFRMRKLEDVFKEIDFYKDTYNIGSVIFNDNTLNLSKYRFIQICQGMKERGLLWSAAIRVDIFDDEMAFMAKEGGCAYLVVGIESFDQERLDFMNKKIKVADIYKTMNLLRKYKIDYHGNILVGFEDETIDDILVALSKIPSGYNVFPRLVYPFIGTKNGKTRLIDQDQETFITHGFEEYILDAGKFISSVLLGDRCDQRSAA